MRGGHIDVRICDSWSIGDYDKVLFSAVGWGSLEIYQLWPSNNFICFRALEVDGPIDQWE